MIEPAPDQSHSTEQPSTPQPGISAAADDTAPGWLTKAAHCVSSVFSPLLVPSYCVAIAMWVTPLAYLPENLRFITTMIVMFITAGLPFAIIVALMRLGRVSDLAISRRSQRPLPLCLAVLCYIGAGIYLYNVHAPVWLLLMVAGATVAVVAAIFISLKWKISGHGLGMGGMTGMLLWLAFNNMYIFNLMPWIATIIVISGLVGSARLVLNYHTPAQIYAGYALGAACVFTAMSATYCFSNA